MATMVHPPTTAIVNGRLWGLAPTDWSLIQEQQCEPVYLAAFERLGVASRTKLLDVGCGAGRAAELAYQRGAQVFGLDAAENLLAVARERVPAGEFRLGQLEFLPYPDDSFGVVTGFNSFQYAAEPITAVMEAKRVGKHDAKILIVTWGEPDGMEAASLVAALKPLLPSAPAGAPGAFALSDPSALRELATTAGLQPEELFDVDSPWHYPDLDHAIRGLRSSGVAARAVQNTSAQAVDEAHTTALLRFRQADGRYRIGASFRCLIARVK